MTIEEIKSDIEKAVPDAGLEILNEKFILVPAVKLLPIAQFLKDNKKYRMDYLSCITAVDYLDEGYFESVNILYSMEKKQGPITLKVRVPRDNPTLPSLTSLYRGAEFQERENYDLFGLVYEGHPDLRRIFMWDEFEGHPMRKDYKQEDQEEIIS